MGDIGVKSLSVWKGQFSFAPPSGLPAISPTRGEITLAACFSTYFATLVIGESLRDN